MIGNLNFVKQAGRLAIVCSSVQLIYGLLAIFFPYGTEATNGWTEALWIVASLGWACAILAILALDAGRPRWLAWAGGIAAIVSVPVRITASIIFIIGSAWDPLPLILLGIFLVLGGTFALGIAILRGNKIHGLHAWAPMIVSIFGIIVTALFSVNLFVHYILLGLWGLSWMYIGYVVISFTSDDKLRPTFAAD